MRAVWVTLAMLAAVTGCASEDSEPTTASPESTPSATTGVASSDPGSGETSEAIEPAGRVEDAVTAYSGAFLTGDEDAAFDLLTTRCQDVIGLEAFEAVVDEAEDRYGAALELTSVAASGDRLTGAVDGDRATVTYTYEVPVLDQTDEPWLVERGGWRNDDC